MSSDCEEVRRVDDEHGTDAIITVGVGYCTPSGGYRRSRGYGLRLASVLHRAVTDRGAGLRTGVRASPRHPRRPTSGQRQGQAPKPLMSCIPSDERFEDQLEVIRAAAMEA